MEKVWSYNLIPFPLFPLSPQFSLTSVVENLHTRHYKTMATNRKQVITDDLQGEYTAICMGLDIALAASLLRFRAMFQKNFVLF